MSVEEIRDNFLNEIKQFAKQCYQQGIEDSENNELAFEDGFDADVALTLSGIFDDAITPLIDRLTAELEAKDRQIAELVAENERLNDFENSQCAKLLAKNGELEAVFQRYRRLGDEGRLVELPCKLCDTVYWISTFEKSINHGKVYAITIQDKFPECFMLSIVTENRTYCKREFERVFISKEAAERAKGGVEK